MGLIYVTHGLAPGAEPKSFQTRFRSDPAAFSKFLAQQAFVTLDAALRGEGNAITVDDATVASAELCRMARAAGHPVVLFVNPGQVESGRPYWFMLLNALCDQLDQRGYQYRGVSYPTATFGQRVTLRIAIKEQVSVLPEEAARVEAVLELAHQWKTGSPVIAPHARTLTLSELRDLANAGVELQNHGWWHANHGSLSPEESAREVRRGREWLQDTFGNDAEYFAVPFGETLPSAEAARWCSVWFTLTGEPYGPVSPTVWNRKDLTFYREEPSSGGPSTRSSLTSRAIAKLAGLFRIRRLGLQIGPDHSLAVSGTADPSLMQPDC
jgi:peptidoglycan/xylan/chitin deacetylase (PgdA/CDA1 family)